MTDRATYQQHQLQNTIQTVVLIIGMLGLLTVLGLALGGIGWLLVFAVFAAITLCFSSRVGTRMLFRFYKATPISPRNGPQLYRILVELSRRAELDRTPTLYYIPSKMHTAFAVGTGANPAIGMTDAMFRDFSTREIAAIMAHEISHIRNRDTLVMGLADAISRFATFLSRLGLFFIFLNLPLIVLGSARISWLAVLIMILSPTISALLQLGLSRTREFAADADGARLSGDPEALASALARLERIHGGAWERIILPGRRHPEPSLLRTHPPTAERVERLLELKSGADSPQILERPQLRTVVGQPSTLASLFDQHPGPRRPGWHWFGTWY